MLVKQVEEKTNRVLDYFLGTNTAWARENGYTEMSCEQAYNGEWYLTGYAPAKPEPTVEERLAELEVQYDMPRVLREIILANPNMYSVFIVGRARELEELAEIIRRKNNG